MSVTEFLSIGSAVVAILMLGSGQLRFNLLTYSLQTMLIAAVTVLHALATPGTSLFAVSLAMVTLKAIGIPVFLNWIIKQIDARNDTGTFLPIPLCMHVGIVLFGMAQFLSTSLPSVSNGTGPGAASAAISLLLTGILFMLTRRAAVSQIIGFLTMENGIFLFALTQTKEMPMLVEMGVLLDLLVAVMISGLIIFRIKKSFEHIDVTQLTGLKD